jgi:hypothetical protein
VSLASVEAARTFQEAEERNDDRDTTRIRVSARSPRAWASAKPEQGRRTRDYEPYVRTVALVLLCLGTRPHVLVVTSVLTAYFVWQLRRTALNPPAAALLLIFGTAAIVTAANRGSLLVAVFTICVVLQGIELGRFNESDRARVLDLFSIAVVLLSVGWIAIHFGEFQSIRRSGLGVPAWAGHKNLFGYSLALALVPAVWPRSNGETVTLPARLVPPVARLFILVPLLLVSRSAGALAVAVGVGVIAVTLRMRPSRKHLMTPGRVFVLSIAVSVVLLNRSSTIRLLGRDQTLTGRTEVWTTVVDRLNHYLFLGDGPGTNWRGWGVGRFAGQPAPLTEAVWNATGQQLTSAHNSLLELCVVLGVILTGVVLALFLRSVLLVARSPGGARLLMLATWVAGSMFAESFATSPLILAMLALVIVADPSPNP